MPQENSVKAIDGRNSSNDQDSINDVFKNIDWYDDKTYQEDLKNLSPEEKITLTNAIQKIAEENPNSLASGYKIVVEFKEHTTVVRMAKYEGGTVGASVKHTAPIDKNLDFNSQSIKGNITGISDDNTHDPETGSLRNNFKKEEQSVDLTIIKVEAKAEFKLFGGEASGLVIQKDGSAWKVKGNVDVGAFEAKLSTKANAEFTENGVEIKGGPSVKAELTLAELSVGGSYYQKPEVTLDSNLNIQVSQREMGIDFKFGVSAEFDALKGKSSMTQGLGFGIIWDKSDLTNNQFYLFQSFEEYQNYTLKVYKSELDTIDTTIASHKYTASDEKYQEIQKANVGFYADPQNSIKDLEKRKALINQYINSCTPGSAYEQYIQTDKALTGTQASPKIVSNTIVTNSGNLRIRSIAYDSPWITVGYSGGGSGGGGGDSW